MPSLKEATVLVVDDEADLRDLLAFEFRLLGSKVCAAGNGLGAMEIVKSQKVDAVITDIRMSGGDGIELLDAIRTWNHAEPVVIFITAYDSEVSPFEAYHMGAEGFFAKPFSLKELVSSVQKALAPPEQRWGTPPTFKPAYAIQQQLPNLDTAQDNRLLKLGRGGMAIALSVGRVSPGEPVSFNLQLTGGPIRRLEGTGMVRWVQQAAAARGIRCGIEFHYLTDDARAPFLAWIRATPCTAYIPRL